MDDDVIDDCAFVFDLGSGLCKAGFSGEESPRFSIPSLVGERKYEKLVPFNVDGDSMRYRYIGDDAQCKRGLLRLRHPIDHGVVTNWDDLEGLLKNIFDNELRCTADELPVLLTEATMSPKSQKEKLAELMFESLESRVMHVANQLVLSHHASASEGGIVLDVGDGVCQVLPMCYGSILTDAAQRLDMGGRDLTKHLVKLLNDRGCSFHTTAEHDIVRDIKEKTGYVAVDFDKEMEVADDVTKTYELPDYQEVTVGRERFLVSEPLFQPKLIGRECPSVHALVHDSIMKCDVDLRKLLYGNITVVGGSSMFPGFPERLERELTALAPAAMPVKVVAPPERKECAWIGGSILASMSNFRSLCVAKKEYDEHGGRIVQQKCGL
ncbi:actin, cytoplasmic-like [Diadema setosum]|uniref:actin, cytoplasmic-like n=1 Tax=Diadema setosum TaxID=31175 RepID=UPI003B3AA766